MRRLYTQSILSRQNRRTGTRGREDTRAMLESTRGETLTGAPGREGRSPKRTRKTDEDSQDETENVTVQEDQAGEPWSSSSCIYTLLGEL